MTAPEPQASSPLSNSDRGGLLIVLAAFACLLAATLNAKPLQSANDRSRWCTVWSLVERSTYHIDEIDAVRGWSTIDKVRHRSEENEPYHFYSSKPPLLSTIVAGLYWAEKQTLGYELRADTLVVTRLLLVLLNIVPMFFALLSLRTSLRLLQLNNRTRWFLLFAAGFASMLNPFLTTLNNHTPAAACLVFCLSAMIRVRLASQPRSSDFAIIGFTAALTCCFELPAALFGVLSFLFLVTVDWKKTATLYVPAALLPLMAFFVTNWICTGGVKPFYAYYGTEKYVYTHEGIPSYWMNPQGIDANTEGTGTYLFHCVFGHHGIFSVTPVFLLALWGWTLGRRGALSKVAWPILCAGAGLSVAILIFYLTRTKNYNYGGNSSALRWMLWLTPFWWYAIAPAVERLTQSRKGNVLLAVLLIPSLYSVAYSMNTPWRPGWIYDRMERAGIINYHTNVAPFNPARFGVISSLPTQPNISTTWFGTDDAAGQAVTLRTAGNVRIGNESGRIVLIDRSSSAPSDIESPHSVRLVCLYDRFRKGGDVLSWAAVAPSDLPDVSEDTESPPVLQLSQLKPPPDWVTRAFRGLESVRAFNAESPRHLRYQKATGEKTAIPCERGAAQVTVDHPQHGKCRQLCQVLYSDELPFGLAQCRITLTSFSTGKCVRSELWTCRNLPQ